jgi:ribosomal protein L37AE/L43A
MADSEIVYVNVEPKGWRCSRCGALVASGADDARDVHTQHHAAVTAAFQAAGVEVSA